MVGDMVARFPFVGHHNFMIDAAGGTTAT